MLVYHVLTIRWVVFTLSQPSIDVSWAPVTPSELGKVTLLYGDADWMDARAGAWLAHQLGRRTEVMMVENAGGWRPEFDDFLM